MQNKNKVLEAQNKELKEKEEELEKKVQDLKLLQNKTSKEKEQIQI